MGKVRHLSDVRQIFIYHDVPYRQIIDFSLCEIYAPINDFVTDHFLEMTFTIHNGAQNKKNPSGLKKPKWP